MAIFTQSCESKLCRQELSMVRKTMKNSITLIGFGNQAKAWALNLRDSGWDVTIALRPDSPSIKLAIDLGFSCQDLKTAAKRGGNFANLTPDHLHHEVLAGIEFAPGSRLI